MKTTIMATMALLCALGCNKNNKSPGTVTTTGGVVTVANEEAITRITEARCDQEFSCNNIGPGRNFVDRSACVREREHNTRADLQSSECPRGVNHTGLTDCLNEIRTEKCGNPFDSISRLAACRSGRLCLR